jgi:hypothetical protein
MVERDHVITLEKILAYKKPDVAPIIQKEKLKREKGCVVRSIESALEVRATEEEWDLRFEQMRSLAGTTPLEKIRRDAANVRQLLADISTHDSPLGRALRRLNHIDFTMLTQEQIRARILEGDKTCIGGGLVERGRIRGMHMAHIDWKGNRFFSRSDGFPIDLAPNTRYHTIAFTSEGKIA